MKRTGSAGKVAMLRHKIKRRRL